MKLMNDSIILISLNKLLARSIAQKLCSKTGKFYLDCESLMEYELSNKDEIIKNCGVDYLAKQEEKFIIGLNEYENTVIVIDYDLFVANNNYNKFQNILSFYLQISKELIENNKSVNIIDKISYIDRDKVLKNKCNIIIDCSNLTNTQIVKKIRGEM